MHTKVLNNRLHFVEIKFKEIKLGKFTYPFRWYAKVVLFC